MIGIVPQRPHLVTGTLAENVSLESAASTDNSKVIECLEKAGLEQFIGVDGQGLELEVTPDSGQLSGGEIQRLGLAIALFFYGRDSALPTILRTSTRLILIIALVQVTLGIATVVGGMPIAIASLHQAVAVALFSIGLLTCHRTYS